MRLNYSDRNLATPQFSKSVRTSVAELKEINSEANLSSKIKKIILTKKRPRIFFPFFSYRDRCIYQERADNTAA